MMGLLYTALTVVVIVLVLRYMGVLKKYTTPEKPNNIF